MIVALAGITPFALVVSLPPFEVHAVEVPLNVTVSFELAANPLPVMVIEEPFVPPVGFSVMLGVTVNETDGASCPPAVTTTACAPAKLPGAVAGTVKVGGVEVGMPPLPVVVVVPDKVTATPAKVTVMVALAGNPEPEIVTTVPTGPLVGLSEAVGKYAAVVKVFPWFESLHTQAARAAIGTMAIPPTATNASTGNPGERAGRGVGRRRWYLAN
ncbi:MAG: hypothetical protein WBF51_06135 [Candidatus Dormiibacterota bacterium]